MKKKLLYFLLFCSVFTSCVESDQDQQKSIFYYNEHSGISSLDPAFARDQPNIWPIHQLFNGLVQFSDSLSILPCIAERWEINGSNYIFHLRKDVFFHDHEIFPDGKGRRVLASDFVYSFERIRDEKVASPGAWVFNHVKKEKGFVALDDHTLAIQLNENFSPFLGLLAMQYCSVVPREIVEHYGKDFRTHPIGTGPFVFGAWEEAVQLNLLKNQNYFEMEGEQKLPYLDAVSIGFLQSRESAFLEFVQGKLDFISGIDGAYKDQLLTKQGQLQKQYDNAFKMIVSPYLNTEYLGFLMDPDPKNPLMKKEVRQAINYGFDRARMIEYLRNSIGIPGDAGFVPQGLPSFSNKNVKGYTYDPKKTARLLKQAGYPDGKGLPEITLSVTPSYQDYCEFIQSQLRESGIKIKLETNQAPVQREFVARSKLKFFRGSWIADYPDAENYLALFYSKNFAPKGPNYTHFSNAAFDSLYELSLMETRDSIRYGLYQTMDNILMEESPLVILYYDQAVRLLQNNISGLESNALNLLTLKKVQKTKK